MHVRTPRMAPTVAAPVLAGCATTLIVLGRLLAAGDPLDQMWAEDGKVFMAGSGSLASFTETYAGYAHTLPRLLAAVGGLLPVGAWAAYAVLAASLSVGALGAFVYCAAYRLTGKVLSAAVAAATLSLTPALMLETLGSLANLQWYLLAGALWTLFLPVRTMPRPAALVTAITAASTPLAVLLLPAALLVHRWDAVRLRSVHGLLASMGVQVAIILFGTHVSDGPPRGMHRPPQALTQFLGWVGGTTATRPLVWAGLVAAAAIVLVGMVCAAPHRVHIVAAVGTAVFYLAVTTYISGFVPSRYVACASMIALAAVALAVGSSTWALPGVGVILAGAVVAFTASSYRLSGPSWEEGAIAWSHDCANGATQAAISVAPANWGVATVPCPGQ